MAKLVKPAATQAQAQPKPEEQIMPSNNDNDNATNSDLVNANSDVDSDNGEATEEEGTGFRVGDFAAGKAATPTQSWATVSVEKSAVFKVAGFAKNLRKPIVTVDVALPFPDPAIGECALRAIKDPQEGDPRHWTYKATALAVMHSLTLQSLLAIPGQGTVTGAKQGKAWIEFETVEQAMEALTYSPPDSGFPSDWATLGAYLKDRSDKSGRVTESIKRAALIAVSDSLVTSLPEHKFLRVMVGTAKTAGALAALLRLLPKGTPSPELWCQWVREPKGAQKTQEGTAKLSTFIETEGAQLLIDALSASDKVGATQVANDLMAGLALVKASQGDTGPALEMEDL